MEKNISVHFSDQLDEVLALASVIAGAMNSSWVDPEHVLLALLHDDVEPNIGTDVLKEYIDDADYYINFNDLRGIVQRHREKQQKDKVVPKDFLAQLHELKTKLDELIEEHEKEVQHDG